MYRFALFLILSVLVAACATPKKIFKTPDGYTEPVLLEEVTVPYPEGAKEQRIGGTVVLKVTLDAAGVVKKAEVVESPGWGMDQAALTAIRQFRFQPAKDPSGNDCPFVFVYRYTFVFNE